MDKLHGLTSEPDEKLFILCMGTDDMLLSHTENARHLVDELELTHPTYKCTPGDRLSATLACILYEIGNIAAELDFIRSMSLDPNSSASVSTPLDPNTVYSKDNCPIAINPEIKDRDLHAHGP